jgi:hypothetical protein
MKRLFKRLNTKLGGICSYVILVSVKYIFEDINLRVLAKIMFASTFEFFLTTHFIKVPGQ